MYRGIIRDPSKDFFVGDNQIIDTDRLPSGEYNDDYWEKRYCLRVEKVPTFLQVKNTPIKLVIKLQVFTRVRINISF